MKLIYIANSSIPSKSANSIHVMKMCEAFAQHNCNVELFVPNYGDGNIYIYDKIFSDYGVDSIFKIKRNFIVNRNPIGVVNYIFAITSVARFCFTKCIIFTRNPLVSFFCIIFRKKHILELHGRLENSSRLIFKAFKFLKLFKSKALIKAIVISRPLYEIYKHNFYIPVDKMVVLSDGVALDSFKQFSKKELVLNSCFSIGYIGSLNNGRGIELIIYLAGKLSKHKFNIYGGEDSQVEILRNNIIQMKLSNVFIYGHICNNQVPKTLCKQDILLMPYQNKVAIRGEEDTVSWMSPMKMFEYMASGRIIMSSNLPVLREVLNDYNSYLIDCDKPQKWVETIEYIEKNYDEARLKAKQAFLDSQMYSWNARAKKIINMF